MFEVRNFNNYFGYISLYLVKIVFVTLELNSISGLQSITMLEDNPNSKKYGKHIRMQGILICNLVFIVIPCKTFTPVYVFQLLHVPCHLNFCIDLLFGWITFFDRLWKTSSEGK